MGKPTRTRQGMTQAVSSNWFKGAKQYTKIKLDKAGINNFKLLMSLGVGVKILDVDQQAGTIVMEGGHTIQAIVEEKIVGKQGLSLIWNHLVQIRKTLRNNGVAHTDIKPANVAVKFLSQDLLNFKVFLIDNEMAKKFGEIKWVGTPQVNCIEQSLINGEKVNEQTDEMGFNYLKHYMGV